MALEVRFHPTRRWLTTLSADTCVSLNGLREQQSRCDLVYATFWPMSVTRLIDLLKFNCRSAVETRRRNLPQLSPRRENRRWPTP